MMPAKCQSSGYIGVREQLEETVCTLLGCGKLYLGRIVSVGFVAISGLPFREEKERPCD